MFMIIYRSIYGREAGYSCENILGVCGELASERLAFRINN
jgi:hypothetical protein